MPSEGFATLKRSVRINNSAGAKSAKVELRRNVLAAVTPARVFDAFAGAGELHGAVWHEAADYCGCDLKWFKDDRTAFVADNRRVLRAIDLRAFNVFDLDAHGSPWEQAVIIADRRRVGERERVGFVITDGSSMKLRASGAPPIGLEELVGVRRAGGLGGKHTELIDVAVAGIADRMNCDIADRWEAVGKSKGLIRYFALVLVGR